MYMYVYTAILEALFSISCSTMKVSFPLKFTTQKSFDTLNLRLVKEYKHLEFPISTTEQEKSGDQPPYSIASSTAKVEILGIQNSDLGQLLSIQAQPLLYKMLRVLENVELSTKGGVKTLATISFVLYFCKFMVAVWGWIQHGVQTRFDMELPNKTDILT